MSEYTMINGKIQTVACEVNLTHHCNLSCRSCGHLSPVSNLFYVRVEDLEKDLSILSKYFHSDYIRLLGGEPLIHPSLLEIISLVKESEISNRIRINTNGIFLWKMLDEFWKNVDEVHVSVKPGQEMTSTQMAFCQEKANFYNTKLEFFYFDRFREGYSETGTENLSLIQRIYNTCYLAHRWHCHTIHQGYFYKCSQSFFLPKVLSKDDLNNPFDDAIELIDNPKFTDLLYKFLSSPTPLKSCKYCLGTVGRLFTLEQVKRNVWRNLQNLPTENLVDQEYLEIVENDPLTDQNCIRS